ncbi:MAG: thioredoxin domain-containing protein [Candidatus Sericytochromatia bacterium]
MSEHDNHLTGQQSPYLLQQSQASVNWQPWGTQAFDKARQTGKPVFLSIGALTCAASQRMDREVFADAEVAAQLQQTFVCIKLDREEQPALARLYLKVCHLMTGAGESPLNLALTADQQPFFVAGFLSKQSYPGHTGLLEVIQQIQTLWQDNAEALLHSAREITALLREQQIEVSPQAPDPTLQERALAELRLSFDDEYGGFQSLPKYPLPVHLLFLLRHGQYNPEAQVTSMAMQTLRALRHGGIWDQLGGGFHHASQDIYWRQPETEKRLADQALLLLAYTRGWQCQPDPLFRQTAEELVVFLQQELLHPEGGFCTALAADNSAGAYYLWSEQELRTLLTPEDWQLAQSLWNIQPSGNFQDARTGRLNGDNQLYLTAPLTHWSERLQLPLPELSARLQTLQQRILSRRQEREKPLCDTTRRSDTNGLVIAALAQAGRVFAQTPWLELAQQTWHWLNQSRITTTGGLLHCADEQNGGTAGFLDDYAFTIWGLLELADSCAGAEQASLRQTALHLYRQVKQRFGDPEEPGYFLADRTKPALIAPLKELYDNSIPTGNAVMLHNLVRLFQQTGEREIYTEAEEMGRLLGSRATQFPLAYLHLIAGWAELSRAR